MKYLLINPKSKINVDFIKNYASFINKTCKNAQNVSICVPNCYISIAKTHFLPNIGIIAQHFDQNLGNYTGIESATMLKDLGVSAAIVGHADRRQIFNETNAQIKEKLEDAAKNNLKIVLSVGEKHTVEFEDTINSELSVLSGENAQNVIIAYEPLCVVNGIKRLEIEKIIQNIEYIKQYVKTKINKDIPVIYGGSVDSNFVKQLIKYDCIDGFLVGKAGVNQEEFLKIFDLVR